MTTGGDRDNDIKQRREALGIPAERFYRIARVSRKSLHNAETGKAGAEVVRKVNEALDKLEAGEPIAEDQHALRVEFRPGVWVTVDADNVATLGDLREVEAKIKRLIDSGR